MDGKNLEMPSMSRRTQKKSHIITATSLDDLPALIPSLLLDNIFHVSKGYWAKKRVEGYGPKFIKTGSRVLYPKDEVISWIESNLHNSTSEN